MGSPCVRCGSRNTSLARAADGHFRKTCGDCGHTGGPYTSRQNSSDSGEAAQAGLDDF
jgi:predicted  nucleic acid-binding Zn-ribbon protein